MKKLILLTALISLNSFAGDVIKAYRKVEMLPAATSDDMEVQINMDNLQKAKDEVVKELKKKCPTVEMVEIKTKTEFWGYENRAMTEHVTATGICR